MYGDTIFEHEYHGTKGYDHAQFHDNTEQLIKSKSFAPITVCGCAGAPCSCDRMYRGTSGAVSLFRPCFKFYISAKPIELARPI